MQIIDLVQNKTIEAMMTKRFIECIKQAWFWSRKNKDSRLYKLIFTGE